MVHLVNTPRLGGTIREASVHLQLFSVFSSFCYLVFLFLINFCIKFYLSNFINKGKVCPHFSFNRQSDGPCPSGKTTELALPAARLHSGVSSMMALGSEGAPPRSRGEK